MDTRITTRGLLERRLNEMVGAEQAAWARMAYAAKHGFNFAREVESAETHVRASIGAHHAKVALAHLERGSLPTRIADQTDRLIRGTFFQRSTSLLARAKGEAEHEVVGQMVNEITAYLDGIAREEQGGPR